MTRILQDQQEIQNEKKRYYSPQFNKEMKIMKTYLYFAALIGGFFLIITAAVRPEIFRDKYEEMVAPVKKYQEDTERDEWQKAREQDRAAWMINHQLTAVCATTTSAVKQLECKYTKQETEKQFENAWQLKIAQGWHP
jgi:hypothetical protein